MTPCKSSGFFPLPVEGPAFLAVEGPALLAVDAMAGPVSMASMAVEWSAFLAAAFLAVEGPAFLAVRVLLRPREK